MKKLIYFLCLSLIVIGCNKETTETIVIVEVPAEEDPDDYDGDDVKKIIEEVDGANPHGPCSYEENNLPAKVKVNEEAILYSYELFYE